MSNKIVDALTYCFYGSGWSVMNLSVDNIDRYMLGYISKDIQLKKEDIIDRTMVAIPHTDHLYVVYNKYYEEKTLNDFFSEDARKHFEEHYDRYYSKWYKNFEDYVEHLETEKWAIHIEEISLKLYGKCMICKMNDKGEIANIEREDFLQVEKYINIGKQRGIRYICM